MHFSFYLHSEEQALHFATAFANSLEKGNLIALQGDLGAGKSTLARAIIRSICQNKDLTVPSPTFTLQQIYTTPNQLDIFHYDLYRLESEDDIYEIGLSELINEGISIVEWPEKLTDEILSKALIIKMEHTSIQNKRRLSFSVPKNLEDTIISFFTSYFLEQADWQDFTIQHIEKVCPLSSFIHITSHDMERTIYFLSSEEEAQGIIETNTLLENNNIPTARIFYHSGHMILSESINQYESNEEELSEESQLERHSQDLQSIISFMQTCENLDHEFTSITWESFEGDLAALLDRLSDSEKQCLLEHLNSTKELFASIPDTVIFSNLCKSLIKYQNEQPIFSLIKINKGPLFLSFIPYIESPALINKFTLREKLLLTLIQHLQMNEMMIKQDIAIKAYQNLSILFHSVQLAKDFSKTNPSWVYLNEKIKMPEYSFLSFLFNYKKS